MSTSNWKNGRNNWQFGKRVVIENRNSRHQLLVDRNLDSLNLYRKHTPKDKTCLFRVVSEYMYLNQSLHNEVRMQTINYMRMHAEKFQQVS